jgi:hypothetical protein
MPGGRLPGGSHAGRGACRDSSHAGTGHMSGGVHAGRAHVGRTHAGRPLVGRRGEGRRSAAWGDTHGKVDAIFNAGEGGGVGLGGIIHEELDGSGDLGYDGTVVMVVGGAVGDRALSTFPGDFALVSEGVFLGVISSNGGGTTPKVGVDVGASKVQGDDRGLVVVGGGRSGEGEGEGVSSCYSNRNGWKITMSGDP